MEIIQFKQIPKATDLYAHLWPSPEDLKIIDFPREYQPYPKGTLGWLMLNKGVDFVKPLAIPDHPLNGG